MLSEFGDPNEECRVYAVLSLPFDLPPEHIVLPLWTLQFRPICLCKLYPYSLPLFITLNSFDQVCDMNMYFDVKLQAPNGIGAVLGVVQLVLYFYYSRVAKEESREPLIISYA